MDRVDRDDSVPPPDDCTSGSDEMHTANSIRESHTARSDSLDSIDEILTANSILTTSSAVSYHSIIDEPFPLLLLPLEIILIILRFLSTPDRLRVRVNRALYQLEAESEFLAVGMSIRSTYWNSEIKMELKDGPRDKYIDGIQKLAANVPMKVLDFDCRNPDRVLIPYVQSIRADYFRFTSSDASVEECTDASLEGWIGDRKRLEILSPVSFTGQGLHQLFMDMESGRTSLHNLYIAHPSATQCRDLLRRVGITCVAGQFHSTRRDVEIFEHKKGADEDIEHYFDFDMSPNHHFFIAIGPHMIIAIRKWTVMHQSSEPHSSPQLVIENLSEDGILRCFRNFEFVQKKNKEFERLTITFSP